MKQRRYQSLTSFIKRYSGGWKALAWHAWGNCLNEIVKPGKINVTGNFILDRALMVVEQNKIDLKFNSWSDGIFEKKNLTLRRTTNITKLTVDVLIGHAISHKRYLRNIEPSIDLCKTLLMDETTVYFVEVEFRI